MQVSRTTALAALVFVAVAAPVGAFALAGDDSGPGTSQHATHPGKARHDKDKDKDKDKAEHKERAKGSDHADDASGAGRAHAEAMKKWARCVAEAASGAKSGDQTGPPKDQCGDKPMPPGLARHLSAGTGPFAPGKGQAKKGSGAGSSGHPFG